MNILINDIRTVGRIILYSCSNLFFWIVGLLIGRSKRVVLFGAWMGTKYCDNSRYLFEFVTKEKERCNVKKVVWATRNPKVYELLKKHGYDCCKIGTLDSIYWHLKSGIHIVCNQTNNSGSYKPDIDIKYSSGAKKVQLWHGVGIKAVGQKANYSQNQKGQRSEIVRRFANSYIIRKIGTLGGWGEAHFLCTSEINKKINCMNTGMHPSSAFISAYPRHCKVITMTDEEQRIVNTIQNYKKSIIYLPTFKDKTNFTHPLCIPGIVELLVKYDILWIEKPHLAARDIKLFSNYPTNILQLKTEFDVNVLMPYINLIVSDYSSAAFDGFNLGIPVLLYVPDLEEYESGSNGLLYDLNSLCPCLLSKNEEQFKKSILQFSKDKYMTDERTIISQKIKKDFFDDVIPSYESIWDNISKL